MTAAHCECACLGCQHFCSQFPSVDGQNAHHARLLLALDRSIAAACRARGISACNGQGRCDPCEVGTLHTRAAELAIALAKVLDDPQGPSDRAHEALERLLLALVDATAQKAATL